VPIDAVESPRIRSCTSWSIWSTTFTAGLPSGRVPKFTLSTRPTRVPASQTGAFGIRPWTLS
jgi:hypothetical protein